jgi:hypothetical protein
MPGKMARSDPRPSVRVTRGAGSGQYLASVLQEGRENANIDACLGFIWRISVYSLTKREELPMSEETLRGWYWVGVIVSALALGVPWCLERWLAPY